MARSPIIGITTHSRNDAGELILPGTYVDAITQAGGTPILLPPNQPNPSRLLDVVDGLILSGGGDISPDLYGATPHPTIYGTDEDRDSFELALAKLALQSQTPVLGICRGMQVLTVASGGDLVVHVPDAYGSAVAHRLDHPRRPIGHDVFILPESRLSEILGTRGLPIVSWHHQAVRNVPIDWRITARAADGVIEALEHQHHPWMFALQWHPELSADHPAHQQLFAAFVAAAAGTEWAAKRDGLVVGG